MKPKRRLPNWTNTFFEYSVISKFKVFSSCFQSSNCTTFHTENSTNRRPKILLKDAPLLHFPFRSYLHVVVTPTFKSTPVLYSFSPILHSFSHIKGTVQQDFRPLFFLSFKPAWATDKFKYFLFYLRFH